MLSLAELNEYKILFKTSNLQQEMMKFGLEPAVLKSIWDQCCGISGSTMTEFILALGLCKHVVKYARFPENINEFKSNLEQDIKILERIEDKGEWAITPEEKHKYDEIFKANDPTGKGYIYGEVARRIFAQSGLRENLLAHIWSLSDVERRGKLNSDEFAVAMHLTYSKLNGIDLPTKLPANLVPPSFRKLQELSDLAKLSASSLLSSRSSVTSSPTGSLLSLADHLGVKGSLPNSKSAASLLKKESISDGNPDSRLELGKCVLNRPLENRDC